MDLPINYTKATWQERRDARNQYVELQDNLCWFCGCFLTGKPSQEVQDAYLNMRLFPKGFLDYPVHLHHDHTTHMTIGAVHSKCNGYLWQYLGE